MDRKRAGAGPAGESSPTGRSVKCAGSESTTESAGYHQRNVKWGKWSAGIGEATDSRSLEPGQINGSPQQSERASGSRACPVSQDQSLRRSRYVRFRRTG